jgi:hypothetical protein
MRDDLPGYCAFQPSALVKGSGISNDAPPPFTAAAFDSRCILRLQV